MQDTNLKDDNCNEILDNLKNISQDENQDNKTDANLPQGNETITGEEELGPSKNDFYKVEKIKDDETFNIKTIKQKIVTVFRAKGGVGSTTIAVFLAFIVNTIKTLIIDLNFNEGCSDLDIT